MKLFRLIDENFSVSTSLACYTRIRFVEELATIEPTVVRVITECYFRCIF